MHLRNGQSLIHIDPGLDAFFALSTDLLCSRNSDGYFERLHDPWTETLGWSLDELRSRPWIEFIHPDDQDSALEIEHLCQQPDVCPLLQYESRFRHQAGHYRWLAWRLSPYCNGISYGIAQDVTERSWSAGLANRQGIQESIQLRDQAIAASSVGMVIADARLAGMPLIYVNPAFERMTGYSASEVLGSNCRFLQGQDKDQPEIETLRQAIRQAKNCTVVLRNYRKDGSLFWNELNISPIYNSAGQLTHFVGVQSDITARKRAEAALVIEQSKTEQLLLNILPGSIAQQLKDFQIGAFQAGKLQAPAETFIGETFADVTVLFADLVGFTKLASHLPAKHLMQLLNQIFSSFDELCDRYQLEKIKTIGDAYMVVGGLPTPHADHVAAIANMALDMQHVIQQIESPGAQRLNLRIGINTGSVIAGVIGTKKFAYDLWGDAVNVASRMESLGKPGKIQVSHTTYQRLRDRYTFRQRGLISAKGKGFLRSYWLTGKSSLIVK